MFSFNGAARYIVHSMLLISWHASSAAASEAMSFHGVFTWVNELQFHKLEKDFPLNPSNRNAEAPSFSAVSLLRPDLKWTQSQIQVVARPRLDMNVDLVEVADTRKQRGHVHAYFKDAFFNWNLSDTLSFTYGLHNYQWGPAEALSPSNRLFHESNYNRSLNGEVLGKYLARLNYTYGQNLSLMFMTEYKPNKEEHEFRYGDQSQFKATALSKVEYSWGGGANYAGLVLGGRENGEPWLGEYVQLSLDFFPGLSLYADGAQQKGGYALRPRYNPSSPEQLYQMARPSQGPQEPHSGDAAKKGLKDIYALSLLGLRFDAEAGWIARIEWIHNQEGLSQDERMLIAQGLGASATEASAASWGADFLAGLAAPGLELQGKEYAYSSLYYPDLGDIKDLSVSLRLLYAFGDDSLYAGSSLEYACNDAAAVYLAASGTRGKATSELASLSSRSVTMGYRHVW